MSFHWVGLNRQRAWWSCFRKIILAENRLEGQRLQTGKGVRRLELREEEKRWWWFELGRSFWLRPFGSWWCPTSRWEPSVCVYMCVFSHVRLFMTLWISNLPGSSVHFPGKNTGVRCHFLLQGIFPTQGSNPSLLYW